MGPDPINYYSLDFSASPRLLKWVLVSTYCLVILGDQPFLTFDNLYR